jgi:hypothetical protein
MTRSSIFAVLIAVCVFGISAEARAQQIGGAACSTPGTAVLANVAPAKADLLPSLSREITGLGRQAVAGNCLVELVCVAQDRSDAARDIASKQCVVVRDLLVKSGFIKANIDTSRKNPGSGRVAGMVYFSTR